MNDIAVKIHDVHQSFGSHHVLTGIDLQVATGQLIALFGPSGSGKTTLLNLIGTLLKPTSGQIEVLGRNILKLSEGKCTKLRRQQLGFIFQSTALLPTYSAAENIDVALRLRGFGYFERRKRTHAILAQVGLTDWAGHVPSELSGGQQQRIAIARVLATQPALILADEPTNGLDTRTTRQMMILFQEIAQDQETTFLMVSHDPMINNFVDKAYDLDGGKIAEREIIKELPEDTDAPIEETELAFERIAE